MRATVTKLATPLALVATIAAFGMSPRIAVGAGSFGAPVITSDLNISEPQIAAASDGTLYIDGPAGAPIFASIVWRSTDHGATWTQTPNGDRDLFPGGGDADIAIDPQDGTLYMTDLWLGDSTNSVSTDRGDSWTANPAGSMPVQDRQWLATTGGGIVYHVTHQVPAGLIINKSVTGGVAYPIVTVAATPRDQGNCICPPGPLIAEAGAGPLGTGDKVGVAFATAAGGIRFAHSSNGATTFTTTTVSPGGSGESTIHGFPVAANAGGGHIVLVWPEVKAGSSYVQFADSNDWGSTWSEPKTIVSAGTSLFPWVAARGSKIAVSLYHNNAAATADTTPEGVAWNESYLESSDDGATFGALSSIDGTAVKTGPVCTAGINCLSDRELGDFQSIVIDAAGKAAVTYNRSNGGSVKVMFARQL